MVPNQDLRSVGEYTRRAQLPCAECERLTNAIHARVRKLSQWAGTGVRLAREHTYEGHKTFVTLLARSHQLQSEIVALQGDLERHRQGHSSASRDVN
jgi:hypothetical protein